MSNENPPESHSASWSSLITRERYIEVARIVFMAVMALLFWLELIPMPVLWVSVVIGLYSLVKTGVLDLMREHKIGTEICVTVATVVALIGGEAVAGAKA